MTPTCPRSAGSGPTWRRRTGYGQRAQVESCFAALKKAFSDRTRARSLEVAAAEKILSWVNLTNQSLVRYPIRVGYPLRRSTHYWLGSRGAARPTSCGETGSTPPGRIAQPIR